MAEQGLTRSRARAATLNLLRAGIKPTVTNVRREIGSGGQQAIQEAIHETLVELARQSAVPGLPVPVVEALRAVWVELENTARTQWDAERAALSARLEQTETELSATRAAFEQARSRLAALENEQAALQRLLTEREADVASLRLAYAQHEAALREATERGAAVEERLLNAQAQIDTLRGAQQQLRAEYAALSEQQRAAQARSLELEATVAEERVQLHAANQARTQAETLAEERARHLQEIAAALEREQSGRAADQLFAQRRIEEEKAAARVLHDETAALRQKCARLERVNRQLEHEQTTLNARLAAETREREQLARALAAAQAEWALLMFCPLH